METIPLYISLLFVATTLATIWLFYKATNQSKTTLAILTAWIVIQGLIGYTGFYTYTQSIPPRFLLLVMPPMLFIIALFSTKKGRQYIDQLDPSKLTILHTVRIPVELVLFGLYIYKMIPELMTFEGRNFDILSGISAPIIYYFGYHKKTLSNKIMVLWNLVCLALLVNIIASAVLSAETPLQQLAFDQPNKAVFYFPYLWLPCSIVPVVLFSHLVCLRKLILKSEG
ncbi:MAG: hypothetical protein HYZ42_03285 [Bacteroidetes bacterium]|nr:hypothetical protein [Bacteroidota bacterium]